MGVRANVRETGAARAVGAGIQDDGLDDRRRVVLLKSLATNNRFYALIAPSSGLRNADTVEEFPPDMLLGVAYPCLEDGLNDFAVIRTTFETMDYFADDEAMRRELMEIVQEAREKLIRRLEELRDRIGNRTAHFLGTDLGEFRSYAMDMLRRGYPRRNLDSMMKLNVFASVAEHEPASNGPDPLFYFEFRDKGVADREPAMSSRQFITAMFEDVLEAVSDARSYASKHVFDRDVFQKFIAIMFVNYATTDPIFYGTHKADYGVSGDREMDDTPLYKAIAGQLREIEARLRSGLVAVPREDDRTATPTREMAVTLPDAVANEEAVLGPLASICAAARRLSRLDDPDAVELARLVLADAAILVEQLKERGIISDAAYDPASNHSRAGR